MRSVFVFLLCIDASFLTFANEAHWKYEIATSGVVLTEYRGPTGRVVVPDKIVGQPVVLIGSGLAPVMAGGGAGITEIVLPGEGMKVSDYAFYGFSDLEDVEFLKAVQEIGNSAFGLCVKLGVLELPDGLVQLGDYAFSECAGLERISLPGSLKKIGRSAFAGCGNLRELELPEGLEEIDVEAFAGAVTLRSVVVPKSCLRIGNGAFAGSEALENLSLPARFTAQIGVIGFTGELASRLLAQGVEGILRQLAQPQAMDEQNPPAISPAVEEAPIPEIDFGKTAEELEPAGN